ncbi:MAG TPA: protein kinase [Polyangiaceae bacterium]
MTTTTTLGPTREDSGRDIGKYRVLAELGRGGMGVVSLAVLRGPGGFHKLLAIKELRPEFVRSPALVAMFVDEARLAARLSHPNIVQTLEAGSEEGRPFLAMEYLEGQPLRVVTQRALAVSSRVPLRTHIGILVDVLSALDYAHGLADFDGQPLGIVHRDISPHNVVLTYDGQTKLVDFGGSGAARLRKAASGDERDVIVGKARYMAPEQAAGGFVDRRADVFAVGVMLWEAVVGKRPWDGQSDSMIMRQLSSGLLPRLRDTWPDVDPGLASIVDRAMSPDPAGRYATALAMRGDLEDYLAMRNMAPQSVRSLGSAITRLFSEERERLRALVDAKLQDPGPVDAVRSSTLQRIAMSVPVTAVSADASGEHVRRISVATPLPPAPAPVPEPQVPRVAVSSPTWPSPKPAPPRAVTVAVVAAAAGAFLTLGTLVVARLRWTETTPAVVAAPEALHASAEPAATQGAAPPVVIAAQRPAPHVTHAVVVASPASARIYLDDAPVPNPYLADHFADEAAHRLRVEAPGYETKTRVVTFAGDIQLELELIPQPALPPAPRPARVDRAPPPEPPRRVSAPEPAPAVSAHIPRPIDTGDPYSK